MKKLIKILILFFIFQFNIIVNAKEFDITSDNVILYNLNDNNILYELNSDEKTNIASLTKIMTVITAIENIEDLNQEIIVPSEAFIGIEEYSQMGLKTGDRLTYKDLLYGIMLPSGADAANTLAISLAGNIDNFVTLMNNKVTELNLENTHFDNPIGMDSENNYSTSKELAEILLYSLDNETFKEIFYTREYRIESLNLTIKSTLIQYSQNGYYDVDNIKGAKSGFTDGAGLCLASVATYDDVTYLLVTLGADTTNRANAIKDTIEIYDYFSTTYSYQKILSKDQLIKKLNIKYGYDKEYELKSTEDVYKYIKNSTRKNRIKYIYDGIEELNYSIKKGDKLGTVTIQYEDEILDTYDIYLTDELEYYHPYLYLIIIVSLIIMIISLKNIKRKKNKKNKKVKKNGNSK